MKKITAASIFAFLLFCYASLFAVVGHAQTAVGCFSPDIKVTCGHKSGTYVVTLQAQFSGAAAPTDVVLTVLTPGVSIVNPQVSYPVNSAGQVSVTLSGAIPGQTIEFGVSGMNGVPDPETGLNICCVGKIKVIIPKDINCKDKVGTLTVLKEAFINGSHYTAQSFPIKTICNGNVVVGSIQDGGAPYVQTGLPVGTTCTVTEGNNIAGPAGFCHPGAIATWVVTSYTPATPVIITPGGVTVTVKNELKCTPVDKPASIQILKKVKFEGAVALPSLSYPITASCDGSVTSIQDGQTITINGLVLGAPCTVTETGPTPAMNATGEKVCGKGKVPVWTKTYAPSQTVNAGPGALVTITNSLRCEKQDVGSFTIKKVIEGNATGLSTYHFPITLDCGSGPLPGTIVNGQVITINNQAVGAECKVTEGQIPPGVGDKACRGNKPVWSTIYVPGQNVTVGQTAGITIINRLECERIIVTPKCIPPTVLNPKTNECYVPRPVCNDGTHWNGKRCVPDVKICRPPTVLNPKTNECYVPRPVCDSGTHWNGKRCVPDVKICRPPTVLNPKTNECYVPRPVCNDGTHWNGKRCVIDVRICPPPLVLNPRNNRCFLPVPKCRRGEVFQNGECIRLERPRPQRCPPFTIPNPATGECIRIRIPLDMLNNDGVRPPKQDQGIAVP